ncbi:MAG TPA: hypothetical protein VGQ99_01885 [Tepidisphaeraceae bacterium]|nr:hypothetical protein [Tepidisphaeraceae bacterium]
MKLYQDLRPAFRQGGDAAIVPPLPEKSVPAWLSPVWESAAHILAEADGWIVCGYSLPEYDIALKDQPTKAAGCGKLLRIWLVDPYARDLRGRYESIAPLTEISLLPELDKALNPELWNNE